jgi:hypothetical protein
MFNFKEQIKKANASVKTITEVISLKSGFGCCQGSTSFP